MERKLEELRDVHKAYAYLITNWTEDKNAVANPLQHCYQVQQAWQRSTRTHHYRDRLEEVVEMLESEITGIRRELAQYDHEHGYRTKGPSSYVTTITTAVDSDNQSSSKSMFVLRVIHSEMERKLEELRDVRKAFVYLTTDWTDEKNLATAKVNQHCYAVQQAWLQAG
ncbi:hypothetical protein BGX23_010513 [Mortierella sp. AD031]|nr:hypothetical protein BGX23_010513 [Mortierella sp. AD031]